MRRSPRPSTGRAAHPDRAALAASFAEDVALDLPVCGGDAEATARDNVDCARPAAAPRLMGQHSDRPVPRPRRGRRMV